MCTHEPATIAIRHLWMKVRNALSLSIPFLASLIPDIGQESVTHGSELSVSIGIAKLVLLRLDYQRATAAIKTSVLAALSMASPYHQQQSFGVPVPLAIPGPVYITPDGFAPIQPTMGPPLIAQPQQAIPYAVPLPSGAGPFFYVSDLPSPSQIVMSGAEFAATVNRPIFYVDGSGVHQSTHWECPPPVPLPSHAPMPPLPQPVLAPPPATPFASRASDGASRTRGIDVSKRKTKLCVNHQAGYCNWGDRCAFAHHPSELQKASPPHGPVRGGTAAVPTEQPLTPLDRGASIT